MTDNEPSPDNTASGFGIQGDLLNPGEWNPNGSPLVELSDFVDIDSYFGFESLIDPDIPPSHEEGKKDHYFDSATMNEPADVQQGDPLEGLASFDRVRYMYCYPISAYKELICSRLLRLRTKTSGHFLVFPRLESLHIPWRKRKSDRESALDLQVWMKDKTDEMKIFEQQSLMHTALLKRQTPPSRKRQNWQAF